MKTLKLLIILIITGAMFVFILPFLVSSNNKEIPQYVIIQTENDCTHLEVLNSSTTNILHTMFSSNEIYKIDYLNKTQYMHHLSNIP